MAIIAGPSQAEIVQNRDDVRGQRGRFIGGRIVRLVAVAVAACFGINQAVVLSQAFGEAEVPPILGATGESLV
jgi:hypothetical protein